MTTLAVTDPEKRFFVHQGSALWSLEDLFAELQTMDDQQFGHHVSEVHNDFANWVSHCFDDQFLAKRMKQARSLDDMRKTIFVSLFK